MRLARGGTIPARCVPCNEPADGRLRTTGVIKTNLNGIASSSAITLAMGAVLIEALVPFLSLAAAVGVATRERVRIDIPACGEHRALHWVPTLLLWGYGAILVFMLGEAVVAAWYGAASWVISGAKWLSIFAPPWAALCLGVRRWTGVKPLTIEAADAHYLWLSGAGTSFFKSIYRVNSPRRQQMAALDVAPPHHVHETAEGIAE